MRCGLVEIAHGRRHLSRGLPRASAIPPDLGATTTSTCPSSVAVHRAEAGSSDQAAQQASATCARSYPARHPWPPQPGGSSRALKQRSRCSRRQRRASSPPGLSTIYEVPIACAKKARFGDPQYLHRPPTAIPDANVVKARAPHQKPKDENAYHVVGKYTGSEDSCKALNERSITSALPTTSRSTSVVESEVARAGGSRCSGRDRHPGPGSFAPAAPAA